MRRLAALMCALAALGATAAQASASFELGVNDPEAFQGGLGASDRDMVLTRARQAGASLVRLGVSWRFVSSRRPRTRSDARDPLWRGYRWDDLDDEVRAAVAAGMKPLVVASSAPGWAEGRRRKADAIAGTWRPDPEAFGDFAHALASRYSGETRDGGGALLPRVRHFQAWNEPNLGSFLMPQLRGPAREQVSAPIYRGLLNSFYSAVKSVHRGNLVVTAGLAPFGDHPARGWFSSTAPIAFTRALLCVGSTRRCPRVRFDAYAMQAFPARDPRQGPLNRDDVNLSVAGLRRVLQLAAGRGTISHRQARQIWMTELAWDGGPSARSRRVQANYLQLSLYILWREGVDAVLWYNVRDRAKRVFTWHSGLFTHGTTVAADRPKPALRAFRFPFVPTARGGHVLAWGRAPASGEPVVVEASAGGGRWRRLGSFPVRPDGVFARSVRAPAHGVLRARQGSATSLSSSVTTIAP